MSALQPNADQLAALRAFAAANGRTWKSKLLHSWEVGDAHGEWTAPLRQVRNTFGPSWLVRFKFPAVQAAPAISGKQPAHSPGPWSEFRDKDSHDVIAADGVHVATVEPINGRDPQGEQDANARLLAAAPYLLGALRLINGFYEIRANMDQATRAIVDAALAKAGAT